MTGSKLLQKTSCYSSEIPINFAEKGKGKQKTYVQNSVKRAKTFVHVQEQFPECLPLMHVFIITHKAAP